MALSGPAALNSLDEALRDIRREEDEIAKRLARSNERVTKFRESEAELLRQLALLRLEPAAQGTLSDSISQAEIRARQAFKQHGDSLAAAEAQLKVLDEQMASLTSERAAALAEVDSRQAEIKALGARIAAEMANDPQYAAKKQQAAEMQAVATESLRKTEQAEADREGKGRPYRDDPLFMYLWERGYGTTGYRANNLERWLDGMVARAVGYSKARPNFAMLNELPLRLREHAERQSANAAKVEAELNELETRAIDAAGGKPIREAMEAAQARIAALDEKIVAAEDERDDCAKRLRDLAQGTDPAFEQALAAFAQSLGREDLQTLLADARRTSTAQDDAIISQIDDTRARIREEDAETRDQKERLKTLATRRRELEDIQYEFKKARFDDPRSSFGEDRLVGDVLNEFLRGGISAADYWGQWRRSQNWSTGGGGFGLPRSGRGPWSDGGGGGFGWPPSGGSGGFGRSSGGGSGGGFSRPRGGGSSGNRKGSSGFKTGGGF